MNAEVSNTQAGAVAELTIGTHEHDWGITPSPAMYRLPAGEYSLYTTPPAAVPVEALEGLVAAAEMVAAIGVKTEAHFKLRAALHNFKERSNG